MMQELSLNILDVAQNSVRADSALTQITVEEDTQADLLRITITDNGCGMTPEQVQNVTDPFFTTRTTRKVGLGVPFLKMAAEMAGGSFSIISEVGVGTTVTAGFSLSHIDRMPLGDMAATVSALIQCNPDKDFVYTRIYNGKSFVADTREFRKVLEEVPLGNPEVVQFISDYINENTMELYDEEAK